MHKPVVHTSSLGFEDKVYRYTWRPGCKKVLGSTGKKAAPSNYRYVQYPESRAPGSPEVPSYTTLGAGLGSVCVQSMSYY